MLFGAKKEISTSAMLVFLLLVFRTDYGEAGHMAIGSDVATGASWRCLKSLFNLPDCSFSAAVWDQQGIDAASAWAMAVRAFILVMNGLIGIRKPKWLGDVSDD